MPRKSAMIRARVSPDLKEKAETIFQRLGLSVTEAITLFYNQVTLNKGLPFEVKIPNTVTRQAMQDLDDGIGVTEADSADDLARQLGI